MKWKSGSLLTNASDIIERCREHFKELKPEDQDKRSGIEINHGNIIRKQEVVGGHDGITAEILRNIGKKGA